MNKCDDCGSRLPPLGLFLLTWDDVRLVGKYQNGRRLHELLKKRRGRVVVCENCYNDLLEYVAYRRYGGWKYDRETEQFDRLRA